MSDGPTNSIVNLGDLSKPADTLIKKISKAVGGIFAPYQTKRMAKAEAEAAIIRTEAQIEITDLHRRAMHRFIQEEADRQENIEQITAKALPQLEDKSNPDDIEDDWVTNFFDKSRIVSDDEMQDLWAKVLAGEANAPGTYSKRTVNFLGDLDKAEAALFQNLIGYCAMIGEVTPVVFDVQAEIYSKNGINFNSLSHLESIGLVRFNNLAGFKRLGLPQKFAITYYGEPIYFEMPNPADNSLQMGKVLLTKIGQELAPICGSKPVDCFLEYLKEKWKDVLPQSGTDQPDADKPDPAAS